MHAEQTAKRTLDLVEEWVPSEVYGHEREYQQELQQFLDERLNEDGMFGGGGTHAVSRERGRSNGDIVIDDTIGVEMKRDLSNSQIDRLKGQIDKYREEYNYVIVCACGIEDMDGWRRLQQDYGGGMGMDPMASPVRFVHKEKATFGQQAAHSSGGAGGKSSAAVGGESMDTEFNLEEFEELPEVVQLGIVAAILLVLAYVLITGVL